MKTKQWEGGGISSGEGGSCEAQEQAVIKQLADWWTVSIVKEGGCKWKTAWFLTILQFKSFM
jgi:hypothetical protein